MKPKYKEARTNGKRHRKRTRPPKQAPHYAEIWRMLDGAMEDVIKHHPEYFNTSRKEGVSYKTIKVSVNKRAAALIANYVVRLTTQGPGGSSRD